MARITLLLLLALAATPVLADDMSTCTTRHAELTKQVAGYTGDARTKRLIEADLKRAMREQAEGDADECLEALDHATKLLADGV